MKVETEKHNSTCLCLFNLLPNFTKFSGVFSLLVECAYLFGQIDQLRIIGNTKAKPPFAVRPLFHKTHFSVGVKDHQTTH